MWWMLRYPTSKYNKLKVDAEAIVRVGITPTTLPPDECWRTSEGEFLNQFRNNWDVVFDGSPFSCAPSTNYGKTLYTAEKSGNTRTVHRFETVDDNPCTFTGTANGNYIDGTYTYHKEQFRGPFRWSAAIY
jgi:hypothetical protein